MNSINKKHTYHFNVIDLLIIIAIIAAIVFASKIFLSDLFNDNLTTVEYTVRVSGVKYQDTAVLEVSDKLRTNNGNTHIGTITEINVSPTITYIFDYPSDRFVSVPKNNSYDIYLKIEAVCGIKNNQFTVNGNIISANKSLIPTLPFEYTDAIIVDVMAQTDMNAERSIETNEI